MDDPISKALAAAAGALHVARPSTETVRYDLARAAVMAFLRALPCGSPAGLTTEVTGATFWNASALAGAVARAEAADRRVSAQGARGPDISTDTFRPEPE